ncbi:MAG: glycosyltransferase [Candidatus Kapabacteria bacterium]|nr:glycosyltransferase [Candidatus Kapabacteria bacterium]
MDGSKSSMTSFCQSYQKRCYSPKSTVFIRIENTVVCESAVYILCKSLFVAYPGIKIFVSGQLQQDSQLEFCPEIEGILIPESDYEIYIESLADIVLDFEENIKLFPEIGKIPYLSIVFNFSGLKFLDFSIPSEFKNDAVIAELQAYLSLKKHSVYFKNSIDIDSFFYLELNSMPESCQLEILFLDCIISDELKNYNGIELSQIHSYQTYENKNNDETDIPMNRVSYDQDFSYGFSNKSAEGVLPDPLPSPLLLNLGCGNDFKEGFINIDLYSKDPGIVKMDVRELDLPDSCADLVFASDILEHISHREIDDTLFEWSRVLKPGAEIIIRCPSLKLQMNAYLSGAWDADIASYMIFGGQTNRGDYHCVGFDQQSLTAHLNNAGFEVIYSEELDIPQDQGYINLNMVVHGRKRAHEAIDESMLANINVFDTDKIPFTEFAEDFLEIEDFDNNESIEFENKLESIEHEVSDYLAEKDQSPLLNIVWEGSQFVWHSLALINREHCSNLIDSGLYNITIIPYENDRFSPEDNSKFMKLQAHDIRYKDEPSEETASKPYVWIRHQWPPKFEEPKGAKWIIMQPWEFSQLRQDFVDLFKQADEIWTPSNFSRNAMINSGLEFNKVQVIPNGIDPNLFTPNGPKMEIETNKRLKFLFVGGTIYRKGIDILLKAYIKAFSATDNVCLVIKDMGTDSFYKGQTALDDINKIKENPNSPEIIYMDEYLSEEEIASLYRACDVFVSPYRGEGFSLPTLEAMACGLPVIVTEGGATDDFVDTEVGWLIPSALKSIGNSIDGKELSGEAFLFEPDEADLVNILKSILLNPTNVLATGLLASFRARAHWNWNRATLKLLSRVDYLTNNRSAQSANKLSEDFVDVFTMLGEAERVFYTAASEISDDLLRQVINEDIPIKYKVFAYNRLAQLAYNMFDTNSTMDFTNKALDLIPGNPDSVFLRAKVTADDQDFVGALELINKLVENWIVLKFESAIGLNLDDLLCFSGDLLLQQDDFEAANNLYAAALKYNNENAQACFGLAMCFRAVEAEEEYQKMLDWAIKLDPEYEKYLDS